MGGAFYHTEIVDGKAAVQVAGDFFNLGAHFIDLFVVCDDGVNVDGYGAVQFVLKLVLDVVNLVVDDEKVSVSRNFGVEGEDQSSRAVVVDNQVVHAVDKWMGKNDLFDFLYQIFFRSLTEKGINGILHGCDSGIEDKNTHQDTESSVQHQSGKLTDDGGKENQAGGNGVT